MRATPFLPTLAPAACIGAVTGEGDATTPTGGSGTGSSAAVDAATISGRGP